MPARERAPPRSAAEQKSEYRLDQILLSRGGIGGSASVPRLGLLPATARSTGRVPCTIPTSLL
jgi:hypothetical protein